MRARCRLIPSFFLWPLFVLLPAGCRGPSELVEAELRTRERELREMHAELEQAQAANQALLHEVGALRQGLPALPPEVASPTYTLRRIVLGRGTGGLDDDGVPGDEALRVVLEPRDSYDHAVKTPGALHVEVRQISPAGLKSPLCCWDLEPRQLLRHWKSGMFSSGYHLTLPWKTWPTSERLRVLARFKLADGRLFETDRDIVVRLAPPRRRPGTPAVVPGEGPSLGVPEGEPLPMPRLYQGAPRPGQGPPLRPSAAGEGEVQPAARWQRSPYPTLESAVRLGPPVPLPNR